MTTEEIKLRTREIQKMMGYKLVNLSDNYENFLYMDDNEENIIYSGGDAGYLTEDSVIPFFHDWNWLMKSVDYIEKLKYKVFIGWNMIVIQSPPLKKQTRTVVKVEFNDNNKKLSTFIAISDFAKLYNNNGLTEYSHIDIQKQVILI